MRDLRINLFSYGDSEDINTWSSLPYHFSNALAARNGRLRRINLLPAEDLRYRLLCRWQQGYAQVRRMLGTEWEPEPFRTRTNYILARRRVRTAVDRHGNADLNLFLTFSFSSYPYSSVPVVHYCDRTYEHYLEESRLTAGRRDRLFIDVERRNLENADLVLTTNQACTDFITGRYDVRRATTLAGGMNTSVVDVEVEELIARKQRSTDLLCIGRGVHSRGIDILLAAFRIFNAAHQRHFTLHIVGVSPSELPAQVDDETRNVRLYPYLDRGIPAERDTYDELIRNARLFVLPMRPGPLPNVLQEVQLHCTPVIISGVADALHGRTQGYTVVESLDPEHFAREMTALVADRSRWRDLARGAHEAVRECTWSRTAEKFIEIVHDSGILEKRNAARAPA